MARKKKDEGHEETDKILAELEKRISKEYTQAEKEISDKLNDYLRRFATKDKIKEQAWKDGKISEQDYLTWRVNQMAMGDRWQAMRDTMANDLTNSAQMAKDITNETMPEVYAVNHNYGTYQVERVAKVNTSYTLYDKDSVKRMFKDEDFYKGPGKKLTKAINEGKQMAWDKKQIQSVMTQSLLQGEAIGDIATRLSKTVGDSDRKAAIRNARTITTGIENAGREDSYKRAEKMGIDLMQEWIATLDDRTRHEHRMLDGMRVKVGDKFKVEGYEIEYPGDPSAEAEMVYNCRCTLVPVLKGHEVDSQDLSLRHTRNMKEETYKEWKESRDIVSHSITKQDELSEMFKQSYIQDYKYLAGQNPYIPNDPDYTPFMNDTAKGDNIVDIPEDVRNKIDEFESKYTSAKSEHYMAIDKDGNVIYETPNSRGTRSVSVPKSVDEQMEGGFSVHNHTVPATFSYDDIYNYERYGEHGFMCDVNGTKYMLYNTNPISKDVRLQKSNYNDDKFEDIMPFTSAVDKAFAEMDEIYTKERREYFEMVKATEPDLTVRRDMINDWMNKNNLDEKKHEWLEENAEKYGFIYKRKKR